MNPDTINGLLQPWRSGRPALLAPDRHPLAYAALCDRVERIVASINRLGIGRNDRVAMALPNGLEASLAFLSVASCASAAPLNPAYREADFRFFLADLGAKALLVERNSVSPAIAAARALRIPVLELSWRVEDPAGTLVIAGSPVGPAKDDGFARADDIALVLHTSGTTARPKLVPLSQRNLSASAANIVSSLQLSPDDRCLNVMPLFHIHGLVAGVLAPLAAGGSVYCTPGFNMLEFFRRLWDARPSWYTAVPTMHQAVLSRAEQNRHIIDEVRLRFVRSSSASLPPAVLHKLEQAFGTPVIESYGMTEAAHQMTSNPLPPGVRRPGSVGLAAGPEIAVMAIDGSLCAAGIAGEIVIRGSNVMAGYENNPEANAVAFTHGWFRTGDQGVLEEDGYLRITGRLKEVINRGGQKVSPREIDDVLMEYPNIHAAAAFPIAHPTLGEEIAAVLVAQPGSMVTEKKVLDFLRGRLAAYKVPRKIVFATDIPKGATGKIQRYELAAAFGLGVMADDRRSAIRLDHRTPTPLEAKLRILWEKALRSKRAIGLDENFSMLGGDSLKAVELLASIKQELGRSMPQSVLFECATVAEMAAYIEMGASADCIVPIQPKGAERPFFCVHGSDGGVLSMVHLAQHMGEQQPFFGIQSVGFDGKEAPLTRVEAMATRYIAEMRKMQPAGPYLLGGYSMGGMVAFEMTRQLRDQGENVALLALFDAYSGPIRRREDFLQGVRRRWTQLVSVRPADLGGYLAQRWRNAAAMTAQGFRRQGLRAKWWLYDRGGANIPVALRPQTVGELNSAAALAYRIYPCECDAVLFKGELRPYDHPQMHEGWKDLIRGRLEIRSIDGRHLEILNERHAPMVAAELLDCIKRSRSGTGTG